MAFWATLVATLIATAVAGVITALFAGWLAQRVAREYTDRAEERKAIRERDESAAAEFYIAYGRFFAAWKSSDDYLDSRSRPRSTVSPADRLASLSRVADAEGLLESFLVRLTLDRPLDETDRDRLWCFRTAYKQ